MNNLPSPDRLNVGSPSAQEVAARETVAGGVTPPQTPPPIAADLLACLAPPRATGEVGWLGKYRILGVLGRGGMGAVFRGEDPSLGRDVAIKVMLPHLASHPQMKDRFLREARSAAKVEHDHVVPIYHVDEDRGVPFLVMPLLKGLTLADWLGQRPKTAAPVERVLTVAAEAAEGLAAAHAKGLVHRDIKPANIWLDATVGDRLRILDFGLARPAIADGADAMSQPGMLLGTPAYMAPEQARGETVDARADLFSLGVVLYRLCTGKLPFDAADPMTVLIALALHDPPPPRDVNPEIPAALSDLVMRLLEKDPHRRPASADEVLAEVRRMQSPTAPPPRRWPWAWVGGALLFAGLAYAAVLFLETPHGTLRVEINDPEIEVRVGDEGPWIKGAGKEPIRLKPGPHGLTVRRGDFEFETKGFTVRRGKEVSLKVDLLPGKVRVADGDAVIGEGALPAKSSFPPLRRGWLERVAELPARSRAEAVEEELRARHPGVEPIYLKPPGIDAGRVVSVTLGKVRDLTPLAALPRLKSVLIGDPSALANLTPLTGLKLEQLEVGRTFINSAPSQVADLSPLRGMPLRLLVLRTAELVNYRPLVGLPLEELWLWRVPADADFAPLGEVKSLKHLHINGSGLSDLCPLAGLRLLRLTVSNAPVADIGPAAAMPLEYLDVGTTKVTSLAPLRGTQVADLHVHGHAFTKEDLDAVASLPLTALRANGSTLRDLGFLMGKELTELQITGTGVKDLSPLRGMPLTQLWIDDTGVTDLTPLKGMALEEFSYPGVPVKDVRVLVGMPLKWVWCRFDRRRDEKVLRAIKTLETINDTPAAEFWKNVGR